MSGEEVTATERDALAEVATRDLVAEAIRRAPLCRTDGTPMVLLGPLWHTCPVCAATEDYDR